MYQRIIKTPDVERLKQRARKLKREKSISHIQALDKVAKDVGFNHWHDVVKSNSLIIPAEKAIADGVVIAFDLKQGMDVDTSDGMLIRDDQLISLVENQLCEIYSNVIAEHDEQRRKYKDYFNKEDLEQHLLERCWDLMYFRVAPGFVNTLDEAFHLAGKYSFWMPLYIWMNGEICDTEHVNEPGVRFYGPWKVTTG